MVGRIVLLGGAPPSEIMDRADFSGNGGRFLRLLFIGGLLQVVTAGFYRFRLLSDVRRHICSVTSVDGDALEYTGRGRELLIGSLLCVLVLATVIFLWHFVSLETPEHASLTSLAFYFILFFVTQLAAFRARQYRLTRTMWRGAAFRMTGSALVYASRSSLWMLLVIATLGLAYPWRAVALERYKMRHTFYGDLQGRFAGTGSEMLGPTIVLWLASHALVAALLNALVGPMLIVGIGLYSAEDADIAPAAITFLGGVYIFVLVLLRPFYQAFAWRWWMSGLRFGAVEFECAVPQTRILSPYFRYFACVLLPGIIFFIGVVMLTPFSYLDKYPGITPMIFAYSFVLFGPGIAYRYFLQYRIWRAIVESLTIRNLGAVDGLAARGVRPSVPGKGLLAGFDIVGL